MKVMRTGIDSILNSCVLFAGLALADQESSLAQITSWSLSIVETQSDGDYLIRCLSSPLWCYYIPGVPHIQMVSLFPDKNTRRNENNAKSKVRPDPVGLAAGLSSSATISKRMH